MQILSSSKDEMCDLKVKIGTILQFQNDPDLTSDEAGMEGALKFRLVAIAKSFGFKKAEAGIHRMKSL